LTPHLLELSRYVHVSPVRIRSHRAQDIRQQIRFLDSFPWSSLPGCLYSANKLINDAVSKTDTFYPSHLAHYAPPQPQAEEHLHAVDWTLT
jgi:hypothetical protein